MELTDDIDEKELMDVNVICGSKFVFPGIKPTTTPDRMFKM